MSRIQYSTISYIVKKLSVHHPQPLFDQECKANWLAERNTMEPPITRMLDADNSPDTDGIMAFIYFLAQVASWKR